MDGKAIVVVLGSGADPEQAEQMIDSALSSVDHASAVIGWPPELGDVESLRSRRSEFR